MTTNRIDTTDLTMNLVVTTAQAMAEASTRRLADMPTFVLPDRPADRSRNGRRGRSSSRRRRFIL